MIRLLIADDHALIREGLQKVFGRETDMEVAAVAKDALEAIELCHDTEINVVVMDVNMPGMSGMEALQQILAIRPGLPVLMLSVLPEQNYAIRVLRDGAAGFISKESAADEIVAAVRRVASGSKYVSAAAANSLAEALTRPERSGGHESLSKREFQVLRMIADGRNSRKIAEQLNLSINTVATYRRRVLQKLGLQSDVDVARYAIENKLLD